MEDTLRESEEHYRSLFDNMLNGYAYCQMLPEEDQAKDFIYLGVNNAFETLTGLKNVTGKRESEVIPGIRDKDPELFEIYGSVASTGVPERFERYVEALGMWFSVSAYSSRKGHSLRFPKDRRQSRSQAPCPTYCNVLRQINPR
jgi:PAS domain-containing protein